MPGGESGGEVQGEFEGTITITRSLGGTAHEARCNAGLESLSCSSVPAQPVLYSAGKNLKS